MCPAGGGLLFIRYYNSLAPNLRVLVTIHIELPNWHKWFNSAVVFLMFKFPKIFFLNVEAWRFHLFKTSLNRANSILIISYKGINYFWNERYKCKWYKWTILWKTKWLKEQLDWDKWHLTWERWHALWHNWTGTPKHFLRRWRATASAHPRPFWNKVQTQRFCWQKFSRTKTAAFCTYHFLWMLFQCKEKLHFPQLNHPKQWETMAVSLFQWLPPYMITITSWIIKGVFLLSSLTSLSVLHFTVKGMDAYWDG